MKHLLRNLRRQGAEWVRLRRLRRDAASHWDAICLGPETDLARLCDLHGSDKGSLLPAGPHPYPWRPHSYSEVYELLFRPVRRHVRWLLECGIGTNNPTGASSMGSAGRPGASLRVWRDYFPAARIVGIDIDDGILFAEDRIETHAVDQTSAESIARFTSKLPMDARFDVIIDDGLHTPEAGMSLFQGCAHLLAQDGIYVIEDIRPKDMERYRPFFEARADSFCARLFVLHRPGTLVGDNCLMVVTRRDP